MPPRWLIIELLGAEHELSEKAAKREEARTKKREEMAKQTGRTESWRSS